MEAIITDHAYDRGKERMGWKPVSLEKMANKALNLGMKHSDSKGSLSKYITKVWFKNRTANNIRIHGETIFIFHDNTLITLYQLPNNLKKCVKYSKNEKEET